MASFESGVWSKSEWDQVWEAGDAKWQMPEHDPFLDKNALEMFKGKQERVFVPLCGKSLDMLWFYQRGHTVIGVEISELAVKEFFEENKFSFEVGHTQDVGNCYKSTDGRMIIYVADLFNLNKDLVGPIDLIWDSASLTAINTEDNVRYVDLLSSFLKKESRWYVYLLNYDSTVWPGPPHSHSDEQVKTLFGDHFTLEMIDEQNMRSEKSGEKSKEETTERIVQKIEAALDKSPYMFSRLYRCLPK